MGVLVFCITLTHTHIYNTLIYISTHIRIHISQRKKSPPRTDLVLVLLAELAEREQAVVHGEGVARVQRLEDALCIFYSWGFVVYVDA